MKSISIDLETYSDVDLSKAGVYKYAQSPNFEVLLFSYSVDDAPVICIDVANGEKIPAEILSALTDPSITKWALMILRLRSHKRQPSPSYKWGI